MTTAKLFTYWPVSVGKRVRRWWLRRRLAQISFHLAHIAEQEENNRHVKRFLAGQQALIQSDLRQI